MIRVSTLLMALILVAGCASRPIYLENAQEALGDDEGLWTYDLKEAFAQAKQQNKPIFVALTASGVDAVFPHGEVFPDINTSFMVEKVFKTEQWKAYARKHLILTLVDTNSDVETWYFGTPSPYVQDYAQFCKDYGVQMLDRNQYIILSPAGINLGKFYGLFAVDYLGKESPQWDFLKTIKGIVEPYK